MAGNDAKCDGLMTVIKEQGDLIRSLKLNCAPKEQVTDTLYLKMQVHKYCTCILHVSGDAILEVGYYVHSVSQKFPPFNCL